VVELGFNSAQTSKPSQLLTTQLLENKSNVEDWDLMIGCQDVE